MGQSVRAMVAQLPPEAFGEYRILRKLGSGAMADVYLALDTLLDRYVAIKFVTPRDAKSRARFFTEARAAARLQHPNIVSVHRVGEIDQRLYIVSEFVQGESLDKVEKPLPSARVVELAIGLVRGLAAAHRNGVLHRDIKPANAVLTATGEAKLIDFGLAKLFEDEVERYSGIRDPADPAASQGAPADGPKDEATTLDDNTQPLDPPQPLELGATQPLDPKIRGLRTASPKLTVPGVLMGTPFYLAPELWNGDAATIRSDIYSLGAMLFELASGNPPYYSPRPEDEGVLKLAARIATQRLAPLAVSAKGVDPGLAAIVDRCLARKPEDRFASCEQLLDALLNLQPAGHGQYAIPEGNPYRGLHAFDAKHRGLFFGRRSEVRAVIERLRLEPFVLVAGDSGVGKSSLCRAGVLPGLAAELDARTWSMVETVPGRRPLSALAAVLSPHVERNLLESDLDLISDELRLRLGKGLGLVVFVDQLEELVTLSDPRDAERYSEILMRLASCSPGIRVLATARSDFLTRLVALPGLGEDIARAIYLLRPMTAANIREAIVAPARVMGVHFESDVDVEMLVKSTLGSAGGLPLLQFALAELWALRDVAAYRIAHKELVAIGGVEGALARHAEHVLEALLPAERAAARRILVKLVSAEGTRSRMTHDTLVGVDRHTVAALDALVRGRLVVARAEESGTEYELAHEALINGWERLKSWLKDDAEERVVRERLARAAGDWDRLRDRELLFSDKQLSELERFEISGFTAAERAFIEGSKRRLRLRRAGRWATVFGAVLAAAVIAFGAGERARLETSRKVAVRLERGRRMLERARGGHGDVDRLRTDAFARFDAHDSAAGESIWKAARERALTVTSSLALAKRELEAALNIDPGRGDVRALLVEAEMLRADIAERDLLDDQLEDAQARLAELDPSNTAMARWNVPPWLEVDTHPVKAEVSIGRYVPRRLAQWTFEPMGSLGTAPVPRRSLEPGSYRLTLEADGYVTVLYPIMLRRGEIRVLDVRMIEKKDVPPGFVYVPEGEFMVGSEADDVFRTSYYSAVPIHRATTGAYLIAQKETTYREWLAFLEGTGRQASLGPWPKGLKREGRGRWKLGLRDPVILRTGEMRDTVRGDPVDWTELPIDRVSVPEAKAYLDWLRTTGRVRRARLCSENEWERAARGADRRLFPHGDRLGSGEAVFDLPAGKDGRRAVGTHPASRSPFGVDDLAGNVWELVSSPQTEVQVFRGGCYYNPALSATTVNRVEEPVPADCVGLRVCADVP